MPAQTPAVLEEATSGPAVCEGGNAQQKTCLSPAAPVNAKGSSSCHSCRVVVLG